MPRHRTKREKQPVAARIVVGTHQAVVHCGHCGGRLITLVAGQIVDGDTGLDIVTMYPWGYQIVDMPEAQEIFLRPTDRHLAARSTDLEIVRKGPTASSPGEVRSARLRLQAGSYGRDASADHISANHIGGYQVPDGTTLRIECPACAGESVLRPPGQR